MNNIKKPFSIKRLKIGAYGIALTAIVIAVIIIVNLLISSLPTTLIHYNTDVVDLYDIGEESMKILDSLDEEITLYYVTEYGAENSDITEILSRYEALSSNITVKNVDPAVNPAFSEKYDGGDTANGGIIVEGSLRSKVVPYSEIFTKQYTDEELYYMSMGVQVQGTSYFMAELAITSAIDYVTRDELPTVYLLSGHGETALDEAYTKLISDENVSTKELNLMTSEAVPDDCESLIICVPTSDIAEAEGDKIKAYMSEGGNVILITDPSGFTSEKCPNIAAVCAEAGLESIDGYVHDYERTYYTNYMFIPELVSSKNGVTSYLDSTNVNSIFYLAHGISKIKDTTATVTAIAQTSDKAVVMIPDEKNESMTYYDDNKTGMTVMVGAQSDVATAGGKRGESSSFVWFSCPSAIDSQYSSFGNDELFVSALNYTCSSTTNLSILGKAKTMEPLVLTEGQGNAWAAVITVIIPAALLVGGFVRWFRRRRK